MTRQRQRGTLPGASATRAQHMEALIQEIGRPAVAAYLEPFAAAGLLEGHVRACGPGTERQARLEECARGVGDTALEAFVFGLGWAINWQLEPEARLWRSSSASSNSSSTSSGALPDAVPVLPGAVRDALLDEAVERGLLEIWPEQRLLGSPATLGSGPIHLRPLAARREAPEGEGPSGEASPSAASPSDAFLSDAFLGSLSAGECSLVLLQEAGSLSAAHKACFSAAERAEQARSGEAPATHPLFLAQLGLRLWRQEQQQQDEQQEHRDMAVVAMAPADTEATGR